MDFMINGVVIKAPATYNAVFAVTSTEDSDRTQDGIMHNVPMFTIAGFDLSWGPLRPSEISIIIKQVIGRGSFTFYGPSPYTGVWETQEFYASNFNMAARTLVDGQEYWNGLSFNIRRINPL